MVGSIQPAWGTAASKTQLQSIITIVIFVLSGLQIKRGEAMQALNSLGSLTYGLVAILALTPLAAPLVLRLPLDPPSLALGLAVFTCMPTSLSSGIAMTQTMGGNVAMAILLTVASNFLAVFTLPLTLPLLLGSAAAGGLGLDPWALFVQLVKVVLLPTVVGATARGLIPGVAQLVDSNKKLIAYISAMCLAAVPWMQVSKALSQQIALTPLSLMAAAACGITVHCLFLACNLGLMRLLRLGGSQPQEAMRIQQAVVLLASQKTLPVAVTVITKLSATMGPAVGLGCMAAVFSHLAQIVVDSMLVSWWLKRYGRLDTKPKTA